MNKHQQRVHHKARKRGERVLRLLATGKSMTEIGVMLGGISRQRVSQLADKARARQ